MPIIETVKLHKHYGATLAVRDVDLKVEQGEILGLLGPNGAGKTTLLKMLSTLIEPTSGRFSVLGHEPLSEHGKLNIRRNIGYLPDFFNLYDDLSLGELLYFFAHTYGVPEGKRIEAINNALEETDLLHKKSDSSKNLSRGMSQRLGLASILVHRPEILLLDEPASGLDPKARIELRRILKKLAGEGRTIIVSSHILTELDDFCSHIAIMNKGRLVLHDRIENIQRTLKGCQILKIKILNSFDTAAKVISDSEGFTLIKEDGGVFEAEYSGDSAEIAKINRKLVETGVDVVSLTEEKKNLEDVFMELTNVLDLEIGSATSNTR